MNFITAPGSTINLQATLSASSAMPCLENQPVPHHPITCPGVLRYTEDGTFGCEHTEVPPGDLRAQYCLDHTMALLLIELAVERERSG